MQIKKILENHKIKAKRIVNKSKGFDNLVYLIYSDTNCCVRIPIKEKNKIIAQVWAFKKWHKIGLPVPKMYHSNQNYLIEELIPGKDFSESKLIKKQKEKIMFQMGKCTKKMHTVKTNGFGYLTKPGMGSKSSWKAFIEPDFFETLKENKKQKLLPREIIEKAHEIYNKNNYLLNLNKPVLIHADLSEENIIIKNGQLSGIIDASDSISGDPYYDLAVVRSSFGERLFKKFIEGYGNIDEIKLKFYLLYYSNWLVLFYGYLNKNKTKYNSARSNF